MKKLVILLTLAILGMSTAAFAAATTPGVFDVSVQVPAATDITYIVSKVTPANAIPWEVISSGSGAPLVWGTSDLKFDTDNKIWTGKHYFAIDLAPSLGVNGDPAAGNYGSVTFAFSDETVPAGQAAGNGLSKRAVLTAVRVTSAGDDPLPLRGPERLGLIGSLSPITQTNVAGGFLRVYVGLYTGSPAVAGAVPPTNGDTAGSYGGKITISATLV